MEAKFFGQTFSDLFQLTIVEMKYFITKVIFESERKLYERKGRCVKDFFPTAT